MKTALYPFALVLAWPAGTVRAEEPSPAAATAGQRLPLRVQIANIRIDEHTQERVLDIQLTPDSTAAFARLTEKSVGRALDIRMNGETVLQPVINSPIETGRLTISFGISPPSATSIEAVAEQLNAGATIDVGLVPAN